MQLTICGTVLLGSLCICVCVCMCKYLFVYVCEYKFVNISLKICMYQDMCVLIHIPRTQIGLFCKRAL